MEDALHATRAAVEEGIVPGGGVALAFRAAAGTASGAMRDRSFLLRAFSYNFV